jgi:hypothetical protein
VTIDDVHARGWIEVIRHAMDTKGLSDPAKQGLWTVKANQLSLEEKMAFSRAVDELAHWFDSRSWEAHS